MSCIFDEDPCTFTVKIKNINMEYPITAVLIKSCPNWASKFVNEKKIELDDMNLNGVHDFFDGIINKQINFTNENCQTILKLSELSGSTKIKEQVKIFINNQKPPQEILKELIQENETNETNSTDKTNNSKEDNKNDQTDKEIYLGNHYNEILSFPELLKNIEIPQHYRIVQYAMNNNKEEFDYHKYIAFVIELLEKEENKKYNLLLSNIDMKYIDIEQLKRLCKIRNFDENYVQHKIINFITKINEQEAEIKKQAELTRKLQTQIDEYQNINKQMIDEVTSNITTLLKQQHQDIQEQIKTLMKNQTQAQNENKHQNDEIKEIINDQQKSINEIKQQNKKIIDEKIDSILSEMKNKFDDINKGSDHRADDIKRIINDQQKSINEIKQQNTQIENNQNSKIEKFFKDQTNLINESNQESKQVIEEKSTTIISELKKEIETNHFKNEFSTITTKQNNTINEIIEIQNKINNLPTFIEQNRGVKEEIIRNQKDKTQQTSQKITEIQNSLNQISKLIEQIDLYYSNMVMRRDYLGESFSGIISSLTKNHGTNINDKGVISISGNRNCNGTYSSLVDFNYSGLSYWSCNFQDSFICFDFKDHCISLSAYSIKSSNHSNPYFLKSWVIEGSNDENEWIELDSRTNEETLCTRSIIRTFHICKKKRIKQPFKFIRLRITGPNTLNRYIIEITNIEFFGKYFKR